MAMGVGASKVQYLLWDKAACLVLAKFARHAVQAVGCQRKQGAEA